MPTSDGMTRVAWLTSAPANPAAPTTAELGAGVNLTDFIASDGLDMGYDQATFDDSTLGSTWATEDGGKKSVAPELTFQSNNSSDTPWTTFAGEPSGYLVVRRNVAKSTAWTASQKVEVVPCKAGVRKPAATAENESTKFTVNFLCRGEVQMAATVAS